MVIYNDIAQHVAMIDLKLLATLCVIKFEKPSSSSTFNSHNFKLCMRAYEIICHTHPSFKDLRLVTWLSTHFWGV